MLNTITPLYIFLHLYWRKYYLTMQFIWLLGNIKFYIYTVGRMAKKSIFWWATMATIVMVVGYSSTGAINVYHNQWLWVLFHLVTICTQFIIMWWNLSVVVLAAGHWISLCFLVSSTYKTDKTRKKSWNIVESGVKSQYSKYYSFFVSECKCRK